MRHAGTPRTFNQAALGLSFPQTSSSVPGRWSKLHLSYTQASVSVCGEGRIPPEHCPTLSEPLSFTVLVAPATYHFLHVGAWRAARCEAQFYCVW